VAQGAFLPVDAVETTQATVSQPQFLIEGEAGSSGELSSQFKLTTFGIPDGLLGS
jgi:hypothetical protein